MSDPLPEWVKDTIETFTIIPASLEEEEPREPEETVNVGDVNPSWMTPLEDFTIGTTAYRWYRLVPAWLDVEFEPCGDEGAIDPNWVSDMDMSYRDILGHSHNFSLVKWALEQGLSPGQPFLVCFEKPTWHKSGGWDGPEEWDADCNWEIVRVMPRKPRTAADAWDRAIQRIRRWEARRNHRQAADLARRLASPGSWKIHCNTRGEWGCILDVSLLCQFKSDPYTGVSLACGTSESRSPNQFKEAFWRLVDNFREKYPEHDPGLVLRLADGLVDVTKWDYLRLQDREDHPEL